MRFVGHKVELKVDNKVDAHIVGRKHKDNLNLGVGGLVILNFTSHSHRHFLAFVFPFSLAYFSDPLLYRWHDKENVLRNPGSEIYALSHSDNVLILP